MSVEELREAAAKIREYAAGANTHGRWSPAPLNRPLQGCRCLSCVEDEPWAWEIQQIDGPDNEDCYQPMHIGYGDAKYIGLMGPDIAEPLASVLSHAADELERHLPHWGNVPGDLESPPIRRTLEETAAIVDYHFGREIAVARAILSAAKWLP